jgi:hypothetical protein
MPARICHTVPPRLTASGETIPELVTLVDEWCGETGESSSFGWFNKDFNRLGFFFLKVVVFAHLLVQIYSAECT